jgi:hypothetical protein
MSFNLILIHGWVSNGCLWIRLGPKTGIGFSVGKETPLFSERYGFRRYIQLPFGYKIQYLRKMK